MEFGLNKTHRAVVNWIAFSYVTSFVISTHFLHKNEAEHKCFTTDVHYQPDAR